MSEIRRLLLEFETDHVARLARKDSKYKKALIKAFSDPSEIVRERALLAAIDVVDPTLVDAIADRIDDEDTDVRIACAEALAWYKQPKTVMVMLRGLLDNNTWVRSHCAFGLSKLLEGPIWARVPREDIQTIIDGFPGMTETEINEFLTRLNLVPDAIRRLIKWREQNFELEIDDSMVLEEIEGKPIILETVEGGEGVLEPIVPSSSTVPAEPSISPEVEEILMELPEDIRESIPPEDIRRLTPATARELVTKLKEQFVTPKEKKPAKKKKVKVRKVRKVKKKKHTRSELIRKIPKAVRDSVGEEVLKSLTIDELEALIGPEEEKPAAKEEEPAATEADSKLAELTNKFGEEKAKILVKLPPDMLSGFKDEDIEQMDIETLQSLLDALGPIE